MKEITCYNYTYSVVCALTDHTIWANPWSVPSRPTPFIIPVCPLSGQAKMNKLRPLIVPLLERARERTLKNFLNLFTLAGLPGFLTNHSFWPWVSSQTIYSNMNFND